MYTHIHTCCITNITVFLFLYSFAKGIDVPTPKSGRKGLEALRSSYGTWLARKNHMTKSSQATFHGHHFKAIMGFILQGYAPRYGRFGAHGLLLNLVVCSNALGLLLSEGPLIMSCVGSRSKHLSDDWLERMFHSCQHRSQSQMSSVSYDNPESHPLLMSHLVSTTLVITEHTHIVINGSPPH